MIYCYETPHGKIVERIMTVAQMEKASREDLSITEGGETLKRRIDVEQGGQPSGDKWQSFWCEASAVHPDQVPEFTKYMADVGVPTEIRKTGEFKYTSRSHRAKALKARGLIDQDGGYGDG